MDDRDAEAITAAARSFRQGAVLVTQDVRLAAAADGHSLDHVDGREIAEVLRTIADPVPTRGNTHKRGWVVRS